MRKFTIIITVIIAALIAAAPATAAGPSNSGAKSAVKKKLRSYSGYRTHMDYPTIRCQRESRTRFYCEFVGLTRADISEGNVDGTSGYANVTYYGGRYAIRVFMY
jgi:hypothetical protein